MSDQFMDPLLQSPEYQEFRKGVLRRMERAIRIKYAASLFAVLISLLSLALSVTSMVPCHV